MLTVAFLILAAVVLMGTALAILHAHGQGSVPWPFGVVHGLAGFGGFGCLVLALQGPPRGLAQGTASFGMIGAVLIALAALAGLAIFAAFRMKRRRAGTLIGIHATLAVCGFVILAAYVFAE